MIGEENKILADLGALKAGKQIERRKQSVAKRKSVAGLRHFYVA